MGLSVGIRFFRLLVNIAILGFAGMLYWSFLLQEEGIKKVSERLEEIHSGLQTVHADMVKLQETGGSYPNQTSFSPNSKRESDQQLGIEGSGLPNLLQSDPFYKTTLPKLLGPNFRPHGTFRTALTVKPEDLHPFSPWAYVNNLTDQCQIGLARLDFGKYESFAPDMAIRVEERISKESGKKEFWIFLRDGVFWAPLKRSWLPAGMELSSHFSKKHQVTAEDFKFYFDALMNPSVQLPGALARRTLWLDAESVDVIDPLTLRVRWKGRMVTGSNGETIHEVKYVAKQISGSLRPLARFVYQYFSDGTKIVPDDSDPDTYRTNSVWAQNFSQHWAKNIIVGCGRWLFDGMTERQISFKRNPDHYFPLDVLLERSEVYFKDSMDNVWQDFKARKLDTCEIRPEQLLELANFLKSEEYQVQSTAGASVQRLDYFGRSFQYIGWNEAKPYFTNKKVRQAITMAIDRQRVIHQNLNDMGMELTGPIDPFSPAYDHSILPWPYDPQRARWLLEEEGWYDHDGDGIIDKEIGGQLVPFRFTLTYFVKTSIGRQICEYVASALKEVGIDCQLLGVDVADLTSAIDDKSLDALFLAWGLGTPPEDQRQLWHSSGAKEKGSSNYIGFVNPEVDRIIEALDFEADPEKRTVLYYRFHAIMHEEAAYTYLFVPKNAFIYRSYVQNVFLPVSRQDLVRGANIAEPDPSIFWLRN